MHSMRIILDTNFLLIPGQFHVDIFSEIGRIALFPYTLTVLSSTREELRKIAAKKGADARAAALALQLLEAKKVDVVDTNQAYADAAILEAVNSDSIVATQDKGLISKLGKKGIRIIRMRSKKHLVLQ